MAQSSPVKRTPKKERDPKRIIAPLVVLAVIYIGLEIFLRVFDVAAYVMPTPTHIIQATISSFYIILPDFLFTLKIICALQSRRVSCWPLCFLSLTFWSRRCSRWSSGWSSPP